MLYSIGKDSSVMLHLARKAFYPGSLPFPLLHVDTGWKFREMYEFRDRTAKAYGCELLVHKNPEGVAMGINPFVHGSAKHTDIMKTEGLKQALNNQRPELWHNYNGQINKGESIRVFPLSNWTEQDIWQYIWLENIEIVPLYLAAERPVLERDGMLMMIDDDRIDLQPGEMIKKRMVRFRTLGCWPLTGAVESNAQTLPEIIEEMLVSTTSERQGRVIDRDQAGSMELKKRQGYF